MAEPFIGEIKIFGGNFAPEGWALCAGQMMSISQYDALFALLGTTYGGDGITTFGLPDLRGRVPVHRSSNGSYRIGQAGGAETVALTSSQIGAHSHGMFCTSAAATGNAPVSNFLAANSDKLPYSSNSPAAQMNPAIVAPVGNGQPHENMLPFLTLNFIIALEGIFPSRS